MAYRIGFPFWRFISNLGMPVAVRIDVFWDQQAKVFVATSPDLRGLVAKAPTMAGLESEVDTSIDDLLTDELGNHHGPTIKQYRPVQSYPA